jgi:hypothetical protein
MPICRIGFARTSPICFICTDVMISSGWVEMLLGMGLLIVFHLGEILTQIEILIYQ